MLYTEITAHQSEVLRDLAELRRLNPLTHCMTNIVAAGFTANVLLAVGASPAMVIGIEESADFARIAGALLVNVGTINGAESESMRRAAQAAHEAATPWVLDPVAAGALRFRTDIVAELLRARPSIIKGNASEIVAVAGAQGGARGVDSTMSSEEAVSRAMDLAGRSGCVVAVTGAIDYVTDGSSTLRIPGGHTLMTKVTGAGCALGALMASFCAVTHNTMRAAAAACAVFAAAGERAAEHADGPGSFAMHFLDQLSLLGTS